MDPESSPGEGGDESFDAGSEGNPEDEDVGNSPSTSDIANER